MTEGTKQTPPANAARQVQSAPDQDIHKGAIEDDRPGPDHSSHPGLDKNGLPNDPKAIAEDVIGANVDETQG